MSGLRQDALMAAMLLDKEMRGDRHRSSTKDYTTTPYETRIKARRLKNKKARKARKKNR